MYWTEGVCALVSKVRFPPVMLCEYVPLMNWDIECVDISIVCSYCIFDGTTMPMSL